MREGLFTDEGVTNEQVMTRLAELDMAFLIAKERRHNLIRQAKEGFNHAAQILLIEHGLKVYTRAEIEVINKKNITNFTQKELL